MLPIFFCDFSISGCCLAEYIALRGYNAACAVSVVPVTHWGCLVGFVAALLPSYVAYVVPVDSWCCLVELIAARG